MNINRMNLASVKSRDRLRHAALAATDLDQALAPQ